MTALALCHLYVDLFQYLRGKGEREGWWGRTRSLRGMLTVVYSLVLDGQLGADNLLRVKGVLDKALAQAFPDRETWGNDAEELDAIPPAARLDW